VACTRACRRSSALEHLGLINLPLGLTCSCKRSPTDSLFPHVVRSRPRQSTAHAKPRRASIASVPNYFGGLTAVPFGHQRLTRTMTLGFAEPTACNFIVRQSSRNLQVPTSRYQGRTTADYLAYFDHGSGGVIASAGVTLWIYGYESEY
jgi:hypothetical protein